MNHLLLLDRRATLADCELHGYHSPVQTYNEVHHVVPRAWQRSWSPNKPPYPGSFDGEPLWDARTVTVCRTGHGNIHFILVALMEGYATRRGEINPAALGLFGENVAFVPLQGKLGGFTIIDAQDEVLVASRKWYRSPHGYAYTSNKGLPRAMHRVLLDAPAGTVVDHRNRNGLDNRRSNLRLATRADNAQNVGPRGGTSEHRGVSFDRDREKWIARIVVDRRAYNLGRYEHENEAASVVEEFLRAHSPFSVPSGPPTFNFDEVGVALQAMSRFLDAGGSIEALVKARLWGQI